MAHMTAKAESWPWLAGYLTSGRCLLPSFLSAGGKKRPCPANWRDRAG